MEKLTVISTNKDLQVNQEVELIRNNKDSWTGEKTLKGSKGVIDSIPTWREDCVDVMFEGDKLHKVISVQDLKIIK